MDKIIKYKHHGKDMSVLEKNKGKHSANSLCTQNCIYFKPGDSKNCVIAQTLFGINIAMNITTPVWECETFVQSKYNWDQAWDDVLFLHKHVAKDTNFVRIDFSMQGDDDNSKHSESIKVDIRYKHTEISIIKAVARQKKFIEFLNIDTIQEHYQKSE